MGAELEDVLGMSCIQNGDLILVLAYTCCLQAIVNICSRNLCNISFLRSLTFALMN